MTKDELKIIMQHLANSYRDFKLDESNINWWYEELKDYNFNDVRNRIKEIMSEDRYQAPTLEYIMRTLIKEENKLNWDEMVYFCSVCKKGFNDTKKLEEHEDRCRSVRYIERQIKRFRWGNVNKRELYAMSEEEFDERYKILLRKVQERTNDELEKQRIEFIFNPPKPEVAKEFIGG